MFVTKLGARAVGRAATGLPAAARLFTSTSARSVDRESAPSKPDVPETPAPPSPSAVGSSVPLSLKTGSSSSSAGSKASSTVAGSSGSSSPSSSKPALTMTTAKSAAVSPALPSIISSRTSKPAIKLPTILTQDWLFAPSASATQAAAADFDPDAPDSSLWALESEIITWFPPSHPHINRSTPAQAHAASLALSRSRSSTTASPTGIFDEDEAYFAHSLFRQLAVSHLAGQSTADKGISPEGARAIRTMADFERSVREADDRLEQLEAVEESEGIRLDSVVRKRKKKMSKHKYKKRIKAQKALRKKLGK